MNELDELQNWVIDNFVKVEVSTINGQGTIIYKNISSKELLGKLFYLKEKKKWDGIEGIVFGTKEVNLIKERLKEVNQGKVLSTEQLKKELKKSE